MWRRLRDLLEMIRFSHTVFALPFALLAAVMAWTAESSGKRQTPFRPLDLLGILLCLISARSAAMAFNRLVDRQLDAQNPRTAHRHLPAGILSTSSVILFTLAMAAAFLASTLLFLPNRMPVYLSLPVLLFLLLYSYTKRFTSLAHFWLGAALMLAPVCVWIALRGAVLLAQPLDLLPSVCLGLAVLLWVAGFDIIYACQDVAFDTQSRLHSVPVRWGVRGALRLAAGCHLLMVLLLAALPGTDLVGGPDLPFGWAYTFGLIGVAALLCYEHSLVRPDDLQRVNQAFFQVNAVISLGLFFVGAFDLLLG